jgi:putative transposase
MSTRIVSGSRGSAASSGEQLECGFLTASGYWAAKRRRPAARTLSDRELLPVLERLHAANYGVYGVRKMWWLLNREGHQVGRDRVARLMRQAGLHGVVRGRKIFTTRTDTADHRPDDLVQRRFTAPAPNRMWVADLTCVRTWAGFCYVAFVVDVYSRMIVGWAASATMRTEDLPLVALETAAWARTGSLDQLIHHSDRGSQYLSIRYTDRLAELGITGSVGSRGDSFDNALAETVNGLFKPELVKRRGPWRSVEQVELATLEWVDWWNHRRLHSALGGRSPAEHETSTIKINSRLSWPQPHKPDFTEPSAIQQLHQSQSRPLPPMTPRGTSQEGGQNTTRVNHHPAQPCQPSPGTGQADSAGTAEYASCVDQGPASPASGVYPPSVPPSFRSRGCWARALLVRLKLIRTPSRRTS